MSRLFLMGLLAHTRVERLVREDQAMGAMDMITFHGYPAEQHKVVTEDNYILTLHRIPSLRRDRRNAPPVLLQHGLVGSSFDFLSPLPSKSLSYSLADAGFDVWLGNSRGNIYSNEHVHHGNTMNNKRYWNFSWDEMSLYDYPAMIDYIVNVTGHPSIYVVGHSQGAHTFITSTTANPSLQWRVKHLFALAPSLSSANLGSLAVKTCAQHPDTVEVALSRIPDRAYSLPLLAPFCGAKNDFRQMSCKWIFTEIAGPIEQVDPTRLGIFTAHLPGGTSNKNWKHWLQQIHNGTKYFDYGPDGNLAAYGTRHPREYDLSQYSVPTSVYFSPADKLVSSKDVEIALSLLPPESIVRVRNLTSFGHYEFIWGERAKAEIYDEIIGEIRRLSRIKSN